MARVGEVFDVSFLLVHFDVNELANIVDEPEACAQVVLSLSVIEQVEL